MVIFLFARFFSRFVSLLLPNVAGRLWVFAVGYEYTQHFHFVVRWRRRRQNAQMQSYTKRKNNREIIWNCEKRKKKIAHSMENEREKNKNENDKPRNEMWFVVNVETIWCYYTIRCECSASGLVCTLGRWLIPIRLSHYLLHRSVSRPSDVAHNFRCVHISSRMHLSLCHAYRLSVSSPRPPEHLQPADAMQLRHF